MLSATRAGTRRDPSRLRFLGLDGARPSGENGRRVSGPTLAISRRRSRRALDRSSERSPEERSARR